MTLKEMKAEDILNIKDFIEGSAAIYFVNNGLSLFLPKTMNYLVNIKYEANNTCVKGKNISLHLLAVSLEHDFGLYKWYYESNDASFGEVFELMTPEAKKLFIFNMHLFI